MSEKRDWAIFAMMGFCCAVALWCVVSTWGTPEPTDVENRSAYLEAIQILDSEHDDLELMKTLSLNDKDRPRLVAKQSKRVARAKRWFHESESRVNSSD